MSKKNVEGLCLALLGAFTGNSQDRLSDQYSSAGSQGAAASLLAVQEKLLKQDLKDNDIWADQVLSNLGLNQQSQVYVSAKVWFLLQSALGRSRANVVSDVVDFLLSTAVSPAADPKYTELARTFAVDVNNGVKWSAAQPQNMSGELLQNFDELKAQVQESRSTELGVINDTVSGLTIALFGAYAGGYFNDLASQVKISGVDTLAKNLTGMQTNAGLTNTNSHEGWSDYVLINFGFNKADDAYSDAKSWFMSALQSGSTRPQVVTDATNYLINLAKNPNLNQTFAPIASKFYSSVAEGIRWSQDVSSKGGANIRELSELQNKYKAPGVPVAQVSKYVELLKPLFAELNSLTQYKTQGKVGVDAAIEKAEIDAEQAIRDALATSTFVYNQDEATTGQSAAANALEDNASKVAQDAWQQIMLEQQSQVVETKKILDILSTQAAVLVERFSNKSAELFADNDRFYQSEDYLLAILDRGTTDYPAGSLFYDFNIETRELVLLKAQDEGDDIVATYSGSTWVNGPAYKNSAEPIKVASVAYFTQYIEYLNKEQELVELLKSLETIDSSLTYAPSVNEIDAYTYLSEDADKYLATLAELNGQTKLISNAEAALEKVVSLRKSDSALVFKLGVDTQFKELNDLGYNCVAIVNGMISSSTTVDDVFDCTNLSLVGDSCTINEFGKSGEDVLVLYGYTKAKTASGDKSILEYKVEQLGKNAVVYLEANQTSFSNGTSPSEMIAINLIGVDTNQLLQLDNIIASA